MNTNDKFSLVAPLCIIIDDGMLYEPEYIDYITKVMRAKLSKMQFQDYEYLLGQVDDAAEQDDHHSFSYYTGRFKKFLIENWPQNSTDEQA